MLCSYLDPRCTTIMRQCLFYKKRAKSTTAKAYFLSYSPKNDRSITITTNYSAPLYKPYLSLYDPSIYSSLLLPPSLQQVVVFGAGFTRYPTQGTNPHPAHAPIGRPSRLNLLRYRRSLYIAVSKIPLENRHTNAFQTFVFQRPVSSAPSWHNWFSA